MKPYAAKIRYLDRLVQQWACAQRSYISGLPAECGHHHVGRNNLLLRWDLRNIVPLTMEEHRAVHDGRLRYDVHNPFRAAYLRDCRHKVLKDYLLEHSLTVGEFIKLREQELLQALGRK